MNVQRNIMITLRDYLKEQVNNITDYLIYFKENNITVNNISELGSGEYSKTYKIETEDGDFALNIRNEMVGDYSMLIGEDYEYLPLVYDVRKIDGKYCVVMEVLESISEVEKTVIDCIDYLFYANDEDGLDVWLEDNLRLDLYLKVEELVNETDVDSISEKQYTGKLKWFQLNYSDYDGFINEIQMAFREYHQVLGFNYSDFHGDNLMQDKFGQIKLIDL
jgi:hypothetical protein